MTVVSHLRPLPGSCLRFFIMATSAAVGVHSSGVTLTPCVDLPDEAESQCCDSQPGVPNNTAITVNELLCFISNKIDIMTQDLLVKLCVDFYAKEVIESAKKLVYSKCKALNSTIMLPRYIKRQGPKKKQSDVLDIIGLCHEMGCNLPVFVAQDLSHLPSVSANSFDIASLMDDIEDMKIQLLGLADMSRLSREINVAVQSITNIRLPNHERHNDGSSCVDRAADSRTDHRSSCVDRAADSRTDGSSCVDRAADSRTDGSSCVDRAADSRTDGSSCVDHAADNRTDGSSCVDRAADSRTDGSSCVDRAADSRTDGSSCVDRAADSHTDRSSCVDLAADSRTDGSTCVDRAADSRTDGSSCVDRAADSRIDRSFCVDRAADSRIDRSSGADRVADSRTDGSSCVGRAADSRTDGSSCVDRAADSRTDGSSCVDRAADSRIDGSSSVGRAADSHTDGSSCVDRAADCRIDRSSGVDRAADSRSDRSSCVGRAADSRTDRSFCVNRAAECASMVTTCPAPIVRPSTSCVDSADGTTGSLRCELPHPCARPLCAASTMAEVVANPAPFRTVTSRRSRRDPPASDDAGTSRPATNKTKKPAHIIGSGESRLSGGIQAAPIRGRHSNTGGLFVSRLAPNTSSSSLKRHIKESCNITAHCVAIKTKYDSYCSFRVFAESNLNRLLDSSVWPTGVLVRDFI